MPSSPIRYVAFLRGINVGGNKKVPMADLKKLLEKNGFENVKTLLASGNVLFDSVERSVDALKKNFESVFQKKFGFTSHVIIRTVTDIEKLLKSDPFKNIKITPNTRLYVTFLSSKPKSTLKIPFESPEKDFRILKVTDGEVCSVLTLNPAKHTTEAMNILEKEYGKDVTTRNWNTVQKLVT